MAKRSILSLPVAASACAMLRASRRSAQARHAHELKEPVPLLLKFAVIDFKFASERIAPGTACGGGEHWAILASLIDAGPPQGRSSHA